MNRTCYDIEVQEERRVKNDFEFSALKSSMDRFHLQWGEAGGNTDLR